jgi:redox-sensitive bicupin YhaK (pirin superfamily)
MAHTILHKASDRFEIISDRGSSYFSFSFGDKYREDRLGFGALRVINDDVIFPGEGFGSHPHDNMEIISIVQEGALTHKDSAGNEGQATPDRLQIISAGTGIFHSEYNTSTSNVCRILQIWVYPNVLNQPPSYRQTDYTYPSPLNQWQLLLEPGLIHQDAWFSLGRIAKGATLSYQWMNPADGVYAFVIDGAVHVEGHHLGPKDALGITGIKEASFRAESEVELLIMEVPMIDPYTLL